MTSQPPAGGPAGRPPRQEREPATEEITEIATGVLRSQLPVDLPGIGHVNCYFLTDERGLAVVDPGLPTPASFDALQQRLRSAGYELNDVHTAVITHSHFDHFGGAERLRTLAGAEIIAHESFRPIWESTEVAEPAELPGLDEDVGAAEADIRPPWSTLRVNPWGTRREPMPERAQQTWLEIARDDPRWFATPQPTRRVADAQTVRLAGRDWLCIHTPGHTEDHLCLYDPAEGIMISGDHVLPTITPHISGLTPYPDPLSRFFDSLERMHDVQGVTTVLPAHGHPFEDLAGRAKAIRRHHEHRLNVIRNAAEDLRAAGVPDYMRRLFSERAWGNMAESETFAHLEHLRLLGEMVTEQRDGQTLFRPA